jgi:hypothetical protein
MADILLISKQKSKAVALLSSYFYVCQQLYPFILPMKKLSKANAAAAFFPTLPSPFICFANDDIVQSIT